MDRRPLLFADRLHGSTRVDVSIQVPGKPGVASVMMALKTRGADSSNERKHT
jgi:hypothetical protein